jgi:hypothetical protein
MGAEAVRLVSKSGERQNKEARLVLGIGLPTGLPKQWLNRLQRPPSGANGGLKIASSYRLTSYPNLAQFAGIPGEKCSRSLCKLAEHRQFETIAL